MTPPHPTARMTCVTLYIHRRIHRSLSLKFMRLKNIVYIIIFIVLSHSPARCDESYRSPKWLYWTHVLCVL